MTISYLKSGLLKVGTYTCTKLPLIVKNKAGKLYHITCKSSNKFIKVARHCFSIEFLKTKTSNAIKAKVLPWSNPAGWDEKMAKASQTALRRKNLKRDAECRLQMIRMQINNQQTGPSSSKDLEKLKEDEALSLKQIETLAVKIDRAETRVKFLKEQRRLQIAGRGASYVGMAANAVIPGSGLLAGAGITALLTAKLEDSTNQLPDDADYKAVEQKNTRLSTYATVAATVAGATATIWLVPTFNATASNLCSFVRNYWSKNLS